LLQLSQIAADPFDFGSFALFPALVRDPLNRLITLLFLAVGENDTCAHKGKISSDLLSDAFGTAGDQRRLASKVDLFGTHRSNEWVKD